jgi:alkyl sulfatase BDS1-like metallo-beta-lactamase superfamily hydrolase
MSNDATPSTVGAHRRVLDDPLLDCDVLAGMLFGLLPVEDAVAQGLAEIRGDRSALERLRGVLDPTDPSFAIVTP